MALQRMDNVLVVVEDLDGAIDFFGELGLELEGRATIDGQWSARVVGLDDQQCEVALMRPPDGHGGLELCRYVHPTAITRTPQDPPVNTLGIGRIMFAVDDIDRTVARLTELGGSLVGDIVQYEDAYRLCYLRGPEGIVIGLAEELR